jgi:hypothetical protein
MALVIKFQSEPNAGREINIPDGQDVVTFGRDSGADVGFPAEMDIVSRDHFRLRRELGVYKFIISREKPVFAGGRPILDGEELDRISEIQLSGPSGPKLRIERLDGAAGNIPKTRVLTGGQDIGDFAQATRTGGRRLGAGLGIAAVLIAGIAAGVYFLREDVITTQATLAAVKTELPTLKADIDKANAAAAARMDSAAIMTKVHDSVYHVQIRFPGGRLMEGGTASVVQLPDGTKALATNSHVAQEFNDINEDPGMAGAKLYVVQPKGPDYPALQVVSVKKHPGYDAFNTWSERVFYDSMADAAQRFVPIPAYDVALLFVADQALLGPPLAYASRETLNAMAQGEPLMTLGYPSEGLAGTDIRRPEPTSQFGIVTSVTTFYFYRGAPSENQLIQHSAPGAGGSSGSPMFNAKGEVVAFYNAGNNAQVETMDGARVPSAAQVNYAIRADLILDLMDGTAEANMPRYHEEMAAEEKRLAKTPEQFLSDLKTDMGRYIGNQNGVSEMGRSELVMDQAWPDGPPNGKLGSVSLELPEKLIYAVVAMSDDRRPIQALQIADGMAVNGGADFAHVSYYFVDNRDLQNQNLVIGVLDMSSTGEKAVTPGKVQIIVLKGVPGEKSMF